MVLFHLDLLAAALRAFLVLETVLSTKQWTLPLILSEHCH